MKICLTLIYCLGYLTLFSQNTEVYLFDISNSDGKLSLTNQRNISNNKGYDNQPSFYNDNVVIFASNRNGQTDIAKYNIRDKAVSFLNSTPNGGEYSPLKITNTNAISAVRLDNDGKQFLYRYDNKTGISKELVSDLVIAYYTWYDESTIVAAVIEESGLNLYVIDVNTGKSRRDVLNVGRSFHKIPNSKLVSFIQKNDDKWILKSLNPITSETRTITEMPNKTEDMCWLINGSALVPINNTIYTFNPKTDKTFKVFASFDDDNLQSITRIATNEIGTMLTLVSEISPEAIVQQQLDAYNSRDIDGFMATYSDDVKLYDFPNELKVEGKDAMKNSYKGFFENTTDLNSKILKRIVVGNKVIDHELVTANGNTSKVVAVYEIENGLINKVTFIY